MDFNLSNLNLPAFTPKLQHTGKFIQIYDVIRKKWIKLSKEEWVRQSFINYLIAHLNYPLGLIAVEINVMYNNINKRADIVVFGKNKKPLVIVECKSHLVKIDEKVVLQALMYFKELQAKYIILTNGIYHYVVKVDKLNQKFIYLKEIPNYLETIE